MLHVHIILVIAFDFCPFYAADASSYSTPNYKQSCRSVAYGICEGAIYDYVDENGCDIKTSELNKLQAKCEDQVDSMTGGKDDDDDDSNRTIIKPECKTNGKNYKRCKDPVKKDVDTCDDIEYYVCGKNMSSNDKQYCKCIGLYGSSLFRGKEE